MQSTDIDLAMWEKLRALGDETRLDIVACLGDEECCVCEVMDRLGLSQSLLSFHLRVLKEAGLVADRREGRWSYYRLNRGALRDLGVAVRSLGSPTRRPPRKRRTC